MKTKGLILLPGALLPLIDGYNFFFNFFIVTVPLSFLSLSAISVLKKIKMIAGGGREGCIQGDYRCNPL